MQKSHQNFFAITCAIALLIFALWIVQHKQIEAANPQTPQNTHQIKAVVVPHHLVASEGIATGIKMLQNESFKKIILMSPDHFNRCKTQVCTTDGIFETFFGRVQTVELSKGSPYIAINKEIFEKEHGINVITPFIANYLPDKKIIPLIFSQKPGWKADKDKVLETVKNIWDDETVLIVSTDFSHYLPLKESDEMDKKTAQTIFNKEIEEIANLHQPDQSDCPLCLWVLSEIADEEGFYNPHIVSHTNSARLLKDENAQETTSHFVFVYFN